jgi:hypothetical protein
MNDRLFVGLTGLASDIQTVEQLLRFKLNIYKMQEERDIKPETFSALVSHILYEKRSDRTSAPLRSCDGYTLTYVTKPSFVIPSCEHTHHRGIGD